MTPNGYEEEDFELVEVNFLSSISQISINFFLSFFLSFSLFPFFLSFFLFGSFFLLSFLAIPEEKKKRKEKKK
jgi:hypothetical protein